MSVLHARSAGLRHTLTETSHFGGTQHALPSLGMRVSRSRPLVTALGITLFLVGCYESHTRSGPPCARVYFPLEGALERVDDVDLLLLVDNSNSMAGEQALLARELPRMFRALALGDLDDDRLLDFRPFRSLHVGVVTTDLGAGPVPAGEVVPSCDAGFGDDGILRSVAHGAITGCETSYPPIFEFESADATVGAADAFATDVSCVANTGTGGCGFEQQLEAVLIAVSPAATPSWSAAGYVPPVFSGGRSGHADGANAGFLRPTSVLAFVLLTDEEDCSVLDYSIYYRDPRFTAAGLNLRCFTFPEMLYPVERYVAGLRGLRRDIGRLVFAGIVGIPADLAGDTPAAYARILADPRVTETPDTDGITAAARLLASCNTADGGEAFPPRRIVEVADGLARLGAVTTIQSICAGDFRPAIERITTLIAEPGGCLPREIVPGLDGTSGCELLERLPPASSGERITTCAALGFPRRGTEVDPDGETHELCVLPQIRLADAESRGGGGVGWYHDATVDARGTCGGAAPGLVALSGTSRAPGATWYLACPHSDVLDLDGSPPLAPLGSPCGARHAETGLDCALTSVPSGSDIDGDGEPDQLECDLATSTCVARCTTDDDCASAGLVGYRCDNTPLGAVLGLESDAPGFSLAPRDVCVRDTCE